MKLGDLVVKAVKEQSAALAARVADCLRFKAGMNYDQSLEFVQGACRKAKVKPPEMSEWDALLYEADQL